MGQGYTDSFATGGGSEFTDTIAGVGTFSAGDVRSIERAGIPYAEALIQKHSHGNILSNLVGDVKDTLLGFPQGVWNLGTSIAYDVNDFNSGHLPTHLYRNVARPFADTMKYQYGPLNPIDFHPGEFYDRFHAHPLGPVLDVAALVSGGAGAAIKAGDAADAARAASVAAEHTDTLRAGLASEGLTQAEIRHLAPDALTASRWEQAAQGLDTAAGGRLSRYAQSVHDPRMLETPEGYQVQLSKGHSPITRSLQRFADRLAMRNPDTRIIGSRSRVDSAFGRSARMHRGEMLAEVRQTENAFRGLTKDEQFAYHIALPAVNPSEVFTDAMHTYRQAASAQLRRYIEKLTGKKMTEVERILKAGEDPMADSPIAAIVKNAPTPAMSEAIRLGRALETHGGDILEKADVLTPETRAARRYMDRVVRSGGRWEHGRVVDITPFDLHSQERGALMRERNAAARAHDAAAADLERRIAAHENAAARHIGVEVPPEPDIRVVEQARAAQAEAKRELDLQQERHYGAEANSDARLRREPVAEARQRLHAANAEVRQAERDLTRHHRAGGRHVDRALQAEADRFAHEIDYSQHPGGVPSAWEERMQRRAQRRHSYQQAERQRLDQAFSDAHGRVHAARERRTLAEQHRDEAMRSEAMLKDRAAAYRTAERDYRKAIAEHERLQNAHGRARAAYERRQALVERARLRAEEAAHRADYADLRLRQAEDRVRGIEEDLSYLPDPNITPEEARSHYIAPGYVGGRTIAELEHERWMEMNGLKDYEVHPDYGAGSRFPHLASERRGAHLALPTGAPLRPVAAPAATKVNRGVRLIAARFITHPTAITRDFLATMGFTLMRDYRDYLTNFAKPLDVGTGDGLSDGHVYFFEPNERSRRGATVSRETREADPLMRDKYALDRTLTEGQLQRLSKETVWSSLEDMPGHLQSMIRQGDRELSTVQQLDALGVKQIPERYARNFLKEFKATDNMLVKFYDRSMDVWRALVLQYRPAWLVYNIIGQHLIWMMEYGGLAGGRAYLDALRLEKDPSGAEWKRMGNFAIKRRRFKWAAQINDVSPGAMLGSFTRSVQRDSAAIWLGDGKLGQYVDEAKDSSWLSKKLPVKTLEKGVFVTRWVGDKMSELNLRIADDVPRRAAFIREAKRDATIKRIRQQAKQFEGVNLTLEEALKRADRPTLERLVKRLDDALGNFTDLNHFERTYLRRMMPFYSWFKVITKLTARLGVEHPGRARLMNLMVQAAGTNPQALPAFPVPSYLQGALALGAADPQGQTMISTAAANPWATPVQLAGIGQQLLPYMRTNNGQPQVTPVGTDSIFGILNPAVGAAAAATGKDLFYGGDYSGPGAGRGAPAQAVGYFAGLPEYRLLQQLGVAPTPYQSKLYDPHATTLGVNNYIWNYLGFPVKRVNRLEAMSRARAGQ